MLVAEGQSWVFVSLNILYSLLFSIKALFFLWKIENLATDTQVTVKHAVFSELNQHITKWFYISDNILQINKWTHVCFINLESWVVITLTVVNNLTSLIFSLIQNLDTV